MHQHRDGEIPLMVMNFFCERVRQPTNQDRVFSFSHSFLPYNGTATEPFLGIGSSRLFGRRRRLSKRQSGAAPLARQRMRRANNVYTDRC